MTSAQRIQVEVERLRVLVAEAEELTGEGEDDVEVLKVGVTLVIPRLLGVVEFLVAVHTHDDSGVCPLDEVVTMLEAPLPEEPEPLEAA